MRLSRTRSKPALERRRTSQRCRYRYGSLAGALLLLITNAPAAFAAADAGDYTEAQTNKGAQIYSQFCSSCHGANLQGQAGPALAGQAFAKSLSFSKMSATQLYHFISSQMPANDPGSLSQDQYEKVLAYILSKNGYPSGQTPLSENTLSKVDLLPRPGNGGQTSLAGR
jgi:mono/diheme cytochrome c family protein